jgi:hypothetical protein
MCEYHLKESCSAAYVQYSKATSCREPLAKLISPQFSLVTVRFIVFMLRKRTGALAPVRFDCRFDAGGFTFKRDLR